MSSTALTKPERKIAATKSGERDAVAVITGLSMPLHEARRLAQQLSDQVSDVRHLIDRLTPSYQLGRGQRRPQREDIAAEIAKLPTGDVTHTALDAINCALTVPATPAQLKAIAGVLLDAYGRPPGDSGATRIAAFAMVVMDNHDDPYDGERSVGEGDTAWVDLEPAPISAECAAAAVRDLWTTFRFGTGPSPADFRAACLRARTRAEQTRYRIRDSARSIEYFRRLYLEPTLPPPAPDDQQRQRRKVDYVARAEEATASQAADAAYTAQRRAERGEN